MLARLQLQFQGPCLPTARPKQDPLRLLKSKVAQQLVIQSNSRILLDDTHVAGEQCTSAPARYRGC